MKRYAIVGFGCGGYHAAKTLREKDRECQIDVYSDVDTAPANPMLTTYYVSGKISREEQFPFGDKERIVQNLGIRLLGNKKVKHVYVEKRLLETEDGELAEYDDIILATGAFALVPPIPGLPQKNVYVMRTVQDADILVDRIKAGISSALVIGASWVGIEVVEALKMHHIPVTMADMAPRIFATATLPRTAEIIQKGLLEKGVDLIFGRGLSSMQETEDGIISNFSDGSKVLSEIVVLCLGLRPSIGYLKEEPISIGRGIRVNEHMQTSVPHIFAVGDCSEGKELLSGNYMPICLWANAAYQGRTAAGYITGGEDRLHGCLVHNIAHFMDTDFVGIGMPTLPGELVEYHDNNNRLMIQAVVNDGILQCMNIFGNYRISGAMKSWFARQLAMPGAPMPENIRLNLLREGIPEEFISMLGGNGR